MNTRKEIKEWFQAYLLIIFIILPTVSVFVEGLVSIDKGFFVMYLVDSCVLLVMFVITSTLVLCKRGIVK